MDKKYFNGRYSSSSPMATISNEDALTLIASDEQNITVTIEKKPIVFDRYSSRKTIN
jgi:hypothetical protein